jgi:hypothetical protein
MNVFCRKGSIYTYKFLHLVPYVVLLQMESYLIQNEMFLYNDIRSYCLGGLRSKTFYERNTFCFVMNKCLSVTSTQARLRAYA